MWRPRIAGCGGPGAPGKRARARRPQLGLALPTDPRRNFVAELQLEDAIDVSGSGDLDDGPIRATATQRHDVELLHRLPIADEHLDWQRNLLQFLRRDGELADSLQKDRGNRLLFTIGQPLPESLQGAA